MKQKKVQKCDYGYLSYAIKSELYKTISMFAVSIGILIFGILLSGSKKNLLTIAAVLGLLPACRSLVNYIMFLKASKYRCGEELHEKINNINHINDTEMLHIRYDLYITSYEKNYPIISMFVANDCLIGYTNIKEFAHNKFEENARTMLGKNNLKIGTIKIFEDETKYLDRLKAVVNNEPKQSKNDLAVSHLMENLSV